MNKPSLDAFRHEIRNTYGSECQLVGRERVDDPLWQGEVLIFDLLASELATRCYAWETNGQVTAVLHTESIDSPIKAVRASLLADPSRDTST